jgi:uncharacterized membrane-anchored protein YjiN (DUF445 family)
MQTSLFVTSVVIAIVQIIKFVKDKAWDSVVTIISAMIVGALAGFFGIEGLTIPMGILIGLSAVGVVTVAQGIGGK